MRIRMALSLPVAMMVLFAGLLVTSCADQETPAPSTGQPSAGWVQLPTEVGEDRPMQWDSPPKMMLDQDKEYRAIMETVHGKMVLELFSEDVPNTVNNFVFLATQGYYDGTTFHRVLPDFMVQGGDPTGTGGGGPGYRFADEFTDHLHETGAISMANSGPNTNGSQFFICLKPQHHLDGRHSVFGQLVEGMDVLQKIRLRDPAQNPSYAGDKLISVRIETKDRS